jgi:hypothetical protein
MGGEFPQRLQYEARFDAATIVVFDLEETVSSRYTTPQISMRTIQIFIRTSPY